jgi:hypothetical protein
MSWHPVTVNVNSPTKRSNSVDGNVWLKPLEQILPIASSNVRFCALLNVVEGAESDCDRVRQLVSRVNAGLRAGHEPRLADEGTGGSYLLRDADGAVCAVFKPSDEEPYCYNNPRGLSSVSPGSPRNFPPSSDATELQVRRARSTTMPSMSDLVLLASQSAPLSFGSPGGAAALAPQQRIRKGIAPGSAACREHAAFLLDHEHRAGVPLTMLAVVAHEAFHVADAHGSRKAPVTKIGSLQEFCQHDYVCEDLPRKTIKRFSVANVHEIALLDLRTFNTDRNGGNLLVRDRSTSASQTPNLVTTPSTDSDGEHEAVALSLSVDSFDTTPARERRLMRRTPTSSPARGVEAEAAPAPVLVPVDHGLCFPEDLQESWFEWLTWPQAKVPFSAEMKARISSLSWRSDWEKLRRFGSVFSRSVRRTLRTAYLLLQVGAAHDLTPYAIASIMCREQLQEMSALEKAMEKAREQLMLSSSGGSGARDRSTGSAADSHGADVADDDGADDEDEFFTVLENLLVELVQSCTNNAKTTDHQHGGAGFQFDDL